MSPRPSHPAVPSAVVPIRLNTQTIRELHNHARERRLPLGTYLRQLLEDFAPGRDVNALGKRNGKIKT